MAQDLFPMQSDQLEGLVSAGQTRAGLSWNRLFSTSDPYNAIRWEQRDAKIVKGDGTVVFEQNDIEVPDFWSQTAIDIVASKYFRGKLDTPERETSVRQMVDRVADTIAGWGFQDGYFATAGDYENFKLDLRFLLVNQYAAFNSPVWFNVGVYEKPQSSACFILAVEDSMQSILDWYRDEGWIFKYGSGSGTNLSKLRSSKETLSRGGRPSGPVSFMKGADGVANAVRSGGTTRRAAKMVVLNADHPDIKDFIYCKKNIEEMVRILEASGVRNSLEGDLFDPYTLLPYQNANNSVRVTDAFMKAVENDADWDLKAVSDGHVIEKVKARGVMNWIADAAWHSADPGMQYDTTINDWNTVSNTGRINASNPCVTGDTLVATSRGLKRIKNLVGTNPEVITQKGGSKALRVFPTGVKQVFRLTTKSGYTVRLTEDHKVAISGKGDVAAKNLGVGDRIQLLGSDFGAKSMPSMLALALGYAIGDGCISHQARGNDPLTWVGGNGDHGVLQQIALAVNEYGATEVHVHASTPGLKVVTSKPAIVDLMRMYAILDRGSALKDFTDQIFDLDRASLAAVLRGLFTADGTVSGNQEKGFYVGLGSTSSMLLEKVQLLLLNFGIKSKLYRNRRKSLTSILPNAKREPQIYPVQQMHGLRITKINRQLFEREIGFAEGTPKAQKLHTINLTTEAYSDRLDDEFLSLVKDTVEPVYDLTEPLTSHFVASGMLVHNCSEYMHLDNSACNLASINLLKFLNTTDSSFDVDSYKKAIDTMITAQEIIVGNSSYPTERITRNAMDYRELGLGYANLGALLMGIGLPYDSNEGRAIAGALTSILCGEGYAQSARIAAITGPFAGYTTNREPMLRVIQKHSEAAEKLSPKLNVSGNGHYAGGWMQFLNETSVQVWKEAYMLGEQFGFRNSQATVLAPTGTIAFLMDCATTGIEPELALVKYKKLVGGGTLKLVNTQIPSALKRLGYTDTQVADISAYLIEKETIEGAPHLKPEHLPVFDCSFKAINGTRSIGYMGHIKMMAAAQPFISGAISKTVNLPTNATVGDIRNVFIESWKLGLKAVAVYRDGSKSVQPMSTSQDKKLVEKINGYTRMKLPDERPSITHKFTLGNHEGYLTVGMYPETKQVGETFITIAKEGSTISGLFDIIATLVSMALQSGVPLKSLVKKFKDARFEPSGITSNENIPFAKSFIDYIFRYLGMKFLSDKEREEIFGAPHEETAATPSAPLTLRGEKERVVSESDAPICDCGTLMFRAGSCFSCPNCFATTGVCN